MEFLPPVVQVHGRSNAPFNNRVRVFLVTPSSVPSCSWFNGLPFLRMLSQSRPWLFRSVQSHRGWKLGLLVRFCDDLPCRSDRDPVNPLSTTVIL